MGAWAEATLHVLRTGARDETIAVVEHLIESLRPRPSPASVRRARTSGKAGK
jgi:hypothetical protein